MKQIVVNNITIELEKKRIKNMYLKILPPDGRVHISAPIRMNEEEIRRFIMTKLEWIKKHQENRKEENNHDTRREISFQNGDEIYFRGTKYLLSVVTKSPRSGIYMDQNTVIMHTGENDTLQQRKKILDRWYKDALISDITLLMPKWEKIIGVKAESFSIRDMRSRWGSCNIRSKNICLNLQLSKKPPQCLEYVVVHELVHLLEKSHNSVFKGYLDQFLPQWRSIKKELNSI